MKCLPVNTVAAPISSLIAGQGEYGKFRADQGAEFAVHAGSFLSGSDLRIMIPPGIHAVGDLQHIPGTELDADSAALAAFQQDIYLTPGNMNLINIQRNASVNV
jgi:hypothetical protein